MTTALDTIELDEGIAKALADAGYTLVEEVLETLANGAKIKGIGKERMAKLAEAVAGYSLDEDPPVSTSITDVIGKTPLWLATDRPVNTKDFLVQPRGLSEDTLRASDESEAWQFYCEKHGVVNRTKYRRRVTPA